MDKEEIQKAAIKMFGSCPILEFDLLLHSRNDLIKFADTVNKSILDRVAELESQLQVANLKVKLNYDTATILENKVAELEKENKCLRMSKTLPDFENATPTIVISNPKNPLIP